MSSIPLTPRPTAAPDVRRISEVDINRALPVLGYATWHLYTRMVER